MLFCQSVCPSTFYIFHNFSKSIAANEKIITEIGLNNCKERNWKKILKNIKNYYQLYKAQSVFI